MDYIKIQRDSCFHLESCIYYINKSSNKDYGQPLATKNAHSRLIINLYIEMQMYRHTYILCYNI